MFSHKIDDLTPRQFKMYYEMLCAADADGFIENIKLVRGITKKDIEKFIEVGAIFEVDGVYLIADWWIHNKKDKYHYKQGLCSEHLEKFGLNKKGAYYRLSEGESRLQRVENESVSKVKLSESNIREVSSNEPLPFNSLPETETVLEEEGVFENYMYQKILDFAKEERIQTSEASIRKFIQYNDRQIFLDPKTWQRMFAGWAKKEMNPTAVVGSEHFDNL